MKNACGDYRRNDKKKKRRVEREGEQMDEEKLLFDDMT